MTPQERHDEIARALCELQIARDRVEELECRLAQLGYGAEDDVHARVDALVRSLNRGQA